MADEDIVQPVPGAEPAPEVTPLEAQPPEAAASEDLPPEVLKIPAMQALMAGNPPAVSANIKDFSKLPEAKLIAANKDALAAHGFDFYRSQGGDLGVIYNSLHINPNDILQADRAGKLKEIAPSFSAINHSVSKSGLRNPVLTVQTPPKGVALATAQAPRQNPMQPAPAVKPAGQGILKNLMSQRVKNLQPGSPLSGPEPGAGRLLNQILKPVT